MFQLAVFIGIYSYALMALGLVGALTRGPILGVTILFFWGLCLVWRTKLHLYSLRLVRGTTLFAGNNPFVLVLVLIIFFQAMVNLVGALGPEMGFDALWYHLTIPRIWLEEHRIFFIGGNLYYSAMPKLIDMLYVWGETPAKLTHLVFGLLSTAVTYKLARKWLDEKWALLAAVIFYSNLVVGWQSITAYVDLGRTFFEALAFYLLVNKKIYKSAIVLGLAIATKLIALGSLPIMLILLWARKGSLKMSIIYFLISIFVSLPWLIFAWINTGNPVYPIFSGYRLDWNWDFNILRLADPISPIYVMVLPMAIWLRRKLPAALVIYCFLSFMVWFLIPRTGGGRFLLPYLPAFSVLAAIVIKQTRERPVQKILLAMVVVVGIVSIGYRAVANTKYLPVILGKQSKQDFLDKYLNRDFGNNFFYLPDDKLKSLYK